MRAASALVLALAAAGCQQTPRTTADCQAPIRVGGATYTSYWSTQREAERHGIADRAECPPAEVLGVRGRNYGFEVYAADSLPVEERDRIFEVLGEPGSR